MENNRKFFIAGGNNMKAYNKIEDFLQLIKEYDLVCVEVGYEVYVELKTLRYIMSSGPYPVRQKEKSRIVIRRYEYEKDIFIQTEEIILQQKIKEYISNKNYFSVEDFEEAANKDTFIEVNDNVWINLYHYGKYNLKEIFRYSKPGCLIFKHQYDKEILDAYFLIKKLQKA